MSRTLSGGNKIFVQYLIEYYMLNWKKMSSLLQQQDV
jgi:hypothetical protein